MHLPLITTLLAALPPGYEHYVHQATAGGIDTFTPTGWAAVRPLTITVILLVLGGVVIVVPLKMLPVWLNWCKVGLGGILTLLGLFALDVTFSVCFLNYTTVSQTEAKFHSGVLFWDSGTFVVPLDQVRASRIAKINRRTYVEYSMNSGKTIRVPASWPAVAAAGKVRDIVMNRLTNERAQLATRTLPRAATGIPGLPALGQPQGHRPTAPRLPPRINTPLAGLQSPTSTPTTAPTTPLAGGPKGDADAAVGAGRAGDNFPDIEGNVGPDTPLEPGMKISVLMGAEWVGATVVETMAGGHVKVAPSTMNGADIPMPRRWLRIDPRNESETAPSAAPVDRKSQVAAKDEQIPQRSPVHEAYKDARPSMPVQARSPTMRRVSASTRLLPGLELLLQHGRSTYYPVVVIDTTPGGQVNVHYPGWGTARDELVPRNGLWVEPAALRAQFEDKGGTEAMADTDAKQPESVTDGDSGSISGARPARAVVRTWTDATGQHSVEAELLELKDGSVTLKRVDNGKHLSMPLEKLSAADQAYVHQSIAEASDKK